MIVIHWVSFERQGNNYLSAWTRSEYHQTLLGIGPQKAFYLNPLLQRFILLILLQCEHQKWHKWKDQTNRLK